MKNENQYFDYVLVMLNCNSCFMCPAKPWQQGVSIGIYFPKVTMLKAEFHPSKKNKNQQLHIL